MVKADAKHDYYADLEVPPDADLETIKKQFRLLAKQYHPDRNPGREIECVPKFQAVQAAHEILVDPQQKAQYDTSRAKYLKKTAPNVQPLKRAATARAPPPTPPFPQPARPRNDSLDRPQFATGRGQPPSSSAEKFAAFNRAGPQQWDRAKYEDAAAKAEALRNFQSMRPGQTQQQQQRNPRAPTAPKPSGSAASPEFARPSNLPPGFPGLSRTQSAPRRAGFSPAASATDEPPAQSAYGYVRSTRDNPISGHGYPYPPPPPASTSPPQQRARPSNSPLRPSRSSGFDDVQRPTFGRTPSRYATHSGEKTDLNAGGGLGRSASVRNSPIDKPWDDHGPFGARAQSQTGQTQPPPRHHSASPKVRQRRGQEVEYSTSESSTEEEKVPPRRKMAVPRRSRATSTFQNSPANVAAFEAQHPSTNYTRIIDDSQYKYPPPEPRDAPHRKPFEDMTNPIDDITDGLHKANFKHSQQDGGPHSNHTGTRSYAPAEARSRNHDSHSKFSAADWDDKFTQGDNVFRPNERDRRSPTKSSRTKPPPTRPRVYSADISDGDSDDISPTMPGVRHVQSHESQSSKSAAFAAGRSNDWAERLRAENGASRQADDQIHSETQANATIGTEPEGVRPQLPPRRASANPDVMDVDTGGDSTHSTHLHAANGTGRRLSAADADTIPRAASRRPSASGVDLSDLANTAPFRTTAEGLESLSADLAGSLPFKSRAAEQIQIATPSGAVLKNLHLPRPPTTVPAPDRHHLTQDDWSQYAERIKQYMVDWNAFDSEMIEHFVHRKKQVNHMMYHNWVTSEGDGVHAQDVDGMEIKDPPGSAHGEDGRSGSQSRSSKLIAGYATYMEWLEQDILCRRYWDLAVEEHRECLEGLGKIRAYVKNLRDRET